MTKTSGRQKPVTMADVARAAGVHSRTVADVLKGTGRVAPGTRENVLRLAQSLNYVPNEAARALVTGRTGKIAVLSGPLSEHYFANAVQLLEAQFAGDGYETMLLHSYRKLSDLASATRASLVDGVVVLAVTGVNLEFLRMQVSKQACVLVSTSKIDFVDHIRLDFRPAIREAMDLMLSSGRSRLAFIVNDFDESVAPEMRLGTYLEKMGEVGKETEILNLSSQSSPEERIRSLMARFTATGFPDAIVCQNDETAIYTYRALTALGRRVPEEVQIVGCDGLPLMEFFDTPLSTISLPMQTICSTASHFLQQRMLSPDLPIQSKEISGALVVRKSLSLSFQRETAAT